MVFTDLCLMTDDVLRLVRFYETVFGVRAEGDAVHSVLDLPGLRLVIYSKAAAKEQMGFDLSGAGVGLMTLGFDCEDALTEHARIASLGVCAPTQPVTRPWGATSFRFDDPDGNLLMVRSWT